MGLHIAGSAPASFVLLSERNAEDNSARRVTRLPISPFSSCSLPRAFAYLATIWRISETGQIETLAVGFNYLESLLFFSFDQRARIAFWAIARRCSGVSFSCLALAPKRPRATAFGFFFFSDTQQIQS
jgi:hypothetical protein